MSTYIRLTDYKDSDSKEQGFFKSENRYEAKQDDFEKIPGSPIAYWVSEHVFNIFKFKGLNSEVTACAGLSTTDNELFTRLWSEIEYSNFGLNTIDAHDCIKSQKKWFPFLKGGDFRNWYGNHEYVVNWKNNGQDLRDYIAANPAKQVGGRIINEEYYFRNGSSWGTVTSGYLSCRFSNNGFIISNATGGIFSDDINLVYYVTTLLNTRISRKIFPIMNPTINYSAGTVAKLPIIFPKDNSIKETIDRLTQECIDISKEEWDSRETSWDFQINPLVALIRTEPLVPLPRLGDVYNSYCDYWREKFYKLHSNEEELNRLFIDIYELQDELTPDVDLKDITILKAESFINDSGNLEFKEDEIIKQFISYAVGCMFGRYSLDSVGLCIANLGSEILVSQMSDESKVLFPIDDDNVIPVLEDDYFSDDIASRVVNFVKVVFGSENLSENINFIEKSLGKTIRAYMVKDFYEDHMKRYKKRPIYWMVSSSKKGFMSLSYMHRYKSDLFARVQNNYLREYITKLEGTKEILKQTILNESSSNKDKNEADKRMKNIDLKLKELISFDRDVLTSFAQNRVKIDLDDGVKVNYNKFKDVLYTIKGFEKE